MPECGLQQEPPTMKTPGPPLSAAVVAEVVGTYLLCFFGPGSVAVAVLLDGHKGLWQVATVWGFGLTVALYITVAISGGHLNPAVTLSMAIFRRQSFPANRVLPYFLAQFAGGVLAALTLLVLFEPTCRHFERQHNIVRGMPGSQLSAMWFGEYFPCPAMYGTDQAAFAQVTPAMAFGAEMLGTAILVCSIFALTDPRNQAAAIRYRLHPFFIGFTVAAIISVIAPLTQAGLNPARDFAPRLVAYFAGWGRIAIPGPRGCEWWVYILAPFIGGLLGAAIWQGLRSAANQVSGDLHVGESLAEKPG